MTTYKIFISSNQREFESERLRIKDAIENFELSEFFEVKMFEDFNASGLSAKDRYLEEVVNSDIYIGLIGEKYGKKLSSGFSPTEEEYNAFSDFHVDAWFFIKKTSNRDIGNTKFIEKISNKHVYNEFENVNDLIQKIKNSLNKFLNEKLAETEIPFDERLIFNSSYEDVDLKAVKVFLEKNNQTIHDLNNKEEIKLILKGLKAGDFKNGIFRLNNAGALFFAKDISKFSINHEIKMARFKGINNNNMIDNLTSNSPLLLLIEEMEIFLRRNMRMGLKIEGFDRIDLPEYPPKAIREALINALAHKDYAISGVPITFFIYDNRLEVSSPGQLPPGVTTENIANKIIHRNKNICNLFQYSKYMENFGRGIDSMCEEMKNDGLPEPEFFEDINSFKVLFKGHYEKSEDYPLDSNNISIIRANKLSLNDRQLKILESKNNEKIEFTIKDYMKKFGVSRSTATRDIKKLVKLNIVKEIHINHNRKIFRNNLNYNHGLNNE